MHNLTASDLLAFPVWEYALDEETIDGRDETWVRPLDTEVVPRDKWALQVAADFKAACERVYSGFVEVITAADRVYVAGGSILHGSDSLFIPKPKMVGFREAREKFLSRLGLLEHDLFPITYTLRVVVEGEELRRTGVLI